MNWNLITTLQNDPQVVQAGMQGCSTEEWIMYLCLRFAVQPPALPIAKHAQGFAYAYINHGRWVVDCPCCRNGALPASKQEPFFWCLSCQMQGNGRRPVRVAFPREAWQIEAILSMRPRKENRNWNPGETIEQLARENILNGCTSFSGGA